MKKGYTNIGFKIFFLSISEIKIEKRQLINTRQKKAVGI